MTTTPDALHELANELEVDVTEFLGSDGSVDDIDGLMILLRSALEDQRDEEIDLVHERYEEIDVRLGNLEDDLLAEADEKSPTTDAA